MTFRFSAHFNAGICEWLKDLNTVHLVNIPIWATIREKVIACETIAAIRKRVDA